MKQRYGSSDVKSLAEVRDSLLDSLLVVTLYRHRDESVLNVTSLPYTFPSEHFHFPL